MHLPRLTWLVIYDMYNFTQEDETMTNLSDPRIENLSDAELATCVDEFVKRSIQHARDVGYDKLIAITISAEQYSSDGDYEIKHKATVGEAWNSPYNSITNNLYQSVDNAVARWLEDQLNTPTQVRTMITHEPELSSVGVDISKYGDAENSPIVDEDEEGKPI